MILGDRINQNKQIVIRGFLEPSLLILVYVILCNPKQIMEGNGLKTNSNQQNSCHFWEIYAEPKPFEVTHNRQSKCMTLFRSIKSWYNRHRILPEQEVYPGLDSTKEGRNNKIASRKLHKENVEATKSCGEGIKSDGERKKQDYRVRRTKLYAKDKPSQNIYESNQIVLKQNPVCAQRSSMVAVQNNLWKIKLRKDQTNLNIGNNIPKTHYLRRNTLGELSNFIRKATHSETNSRPNTITNYARQKYQGKTKMEVRPRDSKYKYGRLLIEETGEGKNPQPKNSSFAKSTAL